MSEVEVKYIIDSKFRRETSNFKVNFDASNVDPTSEDPVLIKYIEKNLKPEEFLGIVINFNELVYSVTAVMNALTDIEAYMLLPAFPMTTMDSNLIKHSLYYVPSTGALSLIGPYEEEEETERRVIDLTSLPATVEGFQYEKNLSADDFTNAVFVMAKKDGTKDSLAVTRVESTSSDSMTIYLEGTTTYVMYTPSIGKLRISSPGDGK